MTADEQALLNAIIAAPEDDLPRLVYADWLEEHGREERAEFIRLECGLSQTKGDRALMRDRAGMAARRDQLLKAHSKQWRAELPRYETLTWGPFMRGMIESAIVRIDRPVFISADELFRAAPIRRLQLNYARADGLRRGLAWPGSSRAVELALHPDRFVSPAETVQMVAEHPWGDRPDWLDLSGFRLDGRSAEELLGIPAAKPFPKLIIKALYSLSDEVYESLMNRFNREVVA